MNKYHLFVLAVFLLLFTGSSMLEGAGNPVTTIVSDSLDRNPNGSSELSLLMREMYDHAYAARKLALEGKVDAVYPSSFDKIDSATPTDEDTKNEHYTLFAGIYIKAIKSYSKSSGENIIDNYNNMVNTCLACHASHCPGPVSKIKKLIISTRP